MRWTTWVLLTALAGNAAAADPQTTAPVADYRFAEGQGDQLVDHSGHGHHGKIVGARWERVNRRFALRFTPGDYVDFGDNRALKMTGDFSVLAWITLDAPNYPDASTNWTVFDCESYPSEGTILRIDGGTATAMFRSSRAGAEFARFGKARIANHQSYLVGVVRQGPRARIIVDGVTDAEHACGGDPVYGSVSFKISSPSQSFAGLIHDVRVFDRALNAGEVAEEYWRGAEAFGKDVRRRGVLSARANVYADDPQLPVEVDFLGAMPLADGERVLLSLTRDGTPVSERTVDSIPDSCSSEFMFDLTGQPAGRYELSTIVRGSDGRSRAAARQSFAWPLSCATEVPSPQAVSVPPLRSPRQRLQPKVSMLSGGGFSVAIEGRSYAVSSRFSVPGAEDVVMAAERRAAGDVVPDGSRVTLRNEHYQLERDVQAQQGRVLVRDKFTNCRNLPVGVMFQHRLRFDRNQVKQRFMGGRSVSPPVTRPLKTNPTTLACFEGQGVGLVALDDVLIVQSEGACTDDELSIGTREFALDAGASYTVEWAVYVNDSGDYYDLVNDLRADEDRNHTTVDGAWVTPSRLMHKRTLEDVPAQKYFDVRRPAYFCIPCLSWCADDPTVSLEGIEFMAYPGERNAVRRVIEAATAGRPNLKTMFHIAPNLYATNEPEKLWPDSRLIGPDGRQTVYAYNYESFTYFTKERISQNWRWWSYYPAMDNSYGRALLDSVDVMMNEMGASGAFIDGALWDYGGAYSYDRFDGHTADIDPATKTVSRLKTAVPLLQQHAIAAWGRKIMERGGVVVANNGFPTRTFAGLPFIFDREVTEGPEIHLFPSPCTLGNPALIQSEPDVYADILAKLAWGNLYFFYGEPLELQHESPAARMYPITVTDLRCNCVTGKERVVTALDGVYGWAGDRSLHMVYRYDRRGRRIHHGFVTTIDAAGARTAIDLEEGEMAIVAKLPVTIEASQPLNAVVTRCDEQAVGVTLNGSGKARITGPDGKSREVDLGGTQTVLITPGTPG
jgi:hypothetical protein